LQQQYLAIKGWNKHQSLNRAGKWIKDYTSQSSDDDVLSQLTMFQRGVFQELRRVRGRLGGNIRYELKFILTAMCARLEDRPRIPAAIDELLACGQLILTDQQHDSINSSEKESKKEKEIEKEIEKEREKSPPAQKPQNAKVVGETQKADKRIEPLPEDFPGMSFAQKVAAEVCLSEPGIMHSIAGAIDFCVKFEGKSKNSATEYLIAKARDEIDRGGRVNKFWFTDRRWRSNETRNSKADMRAADIRESARRVLSETLGAAGVPAGLLPGKIE
jgi:hypothetical protein